LAKIPFRKPREDPESPRTKQMWTEYAMQEFPNDPESVKLEEDGSLFQLRVYARIGE
jgi:hypothetical protein